MTESTTGGASPLSSFRPLSELIGTDPPNPPWPDYDSFKDRVPDFRGRITPFGLTSYREQHRHNPRIADLVEKYQYAFTNGDRAHAFLLSETLAEKGYPPAFRLPHIRFDEMDENQHFDLIVHDLQWIRAQYPEQRDKITSGYRRLLSDGNSWLKVAEYYRTTKNQWEVWLLVRELRLSRAQQWECRSLRGKDVRQTAALLSRKLDVVYSAIMAHLPDMERRHRREQARTLLQRRYAVWQCYEMTDRSPTAAARLFNLAFAPTFESESESESKIDRRHADRDAEWVNGNIPESRNKQIA